MIIAMDIIELLNVYQKNMREIYELDNQITNTSNKEAWKEAMIIRAQKIQVLYKENNEILNQINSFDIYQYEDIDELFNAVNKMYHDDFDDSEVLIPMLHKLINYYEAQEKTSASISNLLVLYSAIAYESTEYVSRVVGLVNSASSYHQKIYELEEYIDLVRIPEVKGTYLLNYYNHLNAISDKVEYLEESYEVYNRLIDLIYNKKAFEDVKDDEYISTLLFLAETTWLVIDDVIEVASDKIKKAFYEVSQKYYNQMLEEHNGKINEIDSQIYISYLHSQAMFNHISYEEAIDKYLEYYFERKKGIVLDENVSDDDFYFLVNGPISIEKLLNHIDNKKRLDIMDRLNFVVSNTWGKILKAKKETPFVNNILAQWCTSTLKYCSSKEAKERKILDLIVKRQFTTYIHSYMVKTMALAIFESLYENNSALFDSLNMKYDDLSLYIESASMLHDIGKTKICDIVTMVRRRLSDYEFAGIKNHPKFGARFIENDKDLAIYKDVILGHHKWYNGKGGYPSDFDNTKSMYRIIIDIITLADCLDAATDYLGRNYKSAKSVKEVLDEFVKDKGIKYNPDIVDIIINNEKLVKKLERLASVDRLDVMYMAFDDIL